MESESGALSFAEGIGSLRYARDRPLVLPPRKFDRLGDDFLVGDKVTVGSRVTVYSDKSELHGLYVIYAHEGHCISSSIIEGVILTVYFLVEADSKCHQDGFGRSCRKGQIE